jgi:PAS domain S-box-containing protein
VRNTAVLLVDDRPENLLTLEAVLAPIGCRLVRARSGDEALKALLQDEFAVILLDVQMPGLDGFETAELIRARERTRAVPIIFVTAISKEPHHVFRGYEAGAVDYLFKPLDPVVLRSKVEVFVELYARGRDIAQREELLRATFDDAPIGMARADADGRLRRVNRALCETMARDADAVVGRTLDELAVRADAGADAAEREALLAGRIARYSAERRLAGPGGTSIPVQVSVSLAPAADGGRPDLILHVQDVRDRKRAERDREQLLRAQLARAQAEAASERLRITQSIAEAALEAEDLDGLLGELLERVLDALDADSAAVVLVDEGERVVAQTAGGVGTVVRPPRGEVDDVVARVVAGRAPVTILDAPGSGVDASSLGPAATSVLAVPLTADGEVIGSIQVGTLARHDFDAEAVELLSLAADRAALAIARTRLVERERHIAQELQRSLLPDRLPDVPGVTMAARYLPGADGTAVGGDWYDAVALPGGRVALAIGDVVGRGIEAATAMGQMRSALRAFLMQGDHTGAMADRLNRFALGLGDMMLTTVVLAVLDPATGLLRYTNAGHPPVLLVAPDGTPRYLEDAASPPMGVLDSPRYPQRTVQLEPGSTLVLYTDGVVETPTELLDLGLDRLLEGARDAGTDVDALCDQLLDAARGPEGGRPDDVTLLVVRAEETLGERVALESAGEAGALRSTRDTLRRWLAEAQATPEEVHDITMACNEACQNAIEHAHALGADLFDVLLERSGPHVAVTVRDRGQWKTTSSEDRGRGMDLMRALMDGVEVDPGGPGSTVRMTRRLRSTGGGGAPAHVTAGEAT